MNIKKEIKYFIIIFLIIIILFYLINNFSRYNDKIKNNNNQSEWLNCYYADPIIFAERIPKLKIEQNESNITYMHYTPERFKEKLKEYLHHIENKFNSKNLYFVFSPGGTTAAISACYYAIQYLEKKKITIKSCVKPPYYTLHKKLANYEKNSEWIDDINKKTDVEVVVSPNNPTGEILKPTFTSKYILLDSVYDKPLFSNKYYTLNPWKLELYKNPYFCEVNSFSKYGYAGVRVGYLITSNKQIADLVTKYFEIKNLGLNSWAMANYEKNIPVIFNKSFGKENYELVQKRHKEIREIIPQRFIYSNNNIPLILLKIPANIFYKYKIKIRPGEEFATSNDYSRINLMVSEDVWKNILKRISSENFQNDIKFLE